MLDKIKQKLFKRNGHSVIISATGIAMGTTKVSGMAVPTVAGDALRKGTRVTTAELPAMTDEKIWKGTGGNVEEVAMPAGPTESWLHSELMEDVIIAAVLAENAHFITNAGTGTFTTPQQINDDDTGTQSAGTTNEYCEIDFLRPLVIRRWRQFGNVANSADGAAKIQYFNLVTDTWEDWVTGIAARDLASWSSYVTETPVLTTKIRFIVITPPTSGYYKIMELEVIY